MGISSLLCASAQRLTASPRHSWHERLQGHLRSLVLNRRISEQPLLESRSLVIRTGKVLNTSRHHRNISPVRKIAVFNPLEMCSTPSGMKETLIHTSPRP